MTWKRPHILVLYYKKKNNQNMMDGHDKTYIRLYRINCY